MDRAEELCIECPHRQFCSDLCPEAEMYASQDAVPQRELTIGLPRWGKWPEPTEKSKFTRTEKRILQLLASGKSRKKIAEALDFTRNTLEKHISNIKKKS